MSRCITILVATLSTTAVLTWSGTAAAQEARQVMEEAQKRAQADSQHY